ncbi:hypothetical protein P6166_02380 [Stenotrophomonas sp. HITSZ_GD]|uniref:hypothetical protein n=1 Tax=Stenotrophomonas sp. HITSZ_GD TaxID=3037248 RepID=UPI00240E7E25|nr:hypothetical protein [Stenotrophomonas sp. HITSZ_GD]MDG2524205.1 hypothetical protein [Stenotrophomonas sp. HITSZ_GD]
MTYEIALRVVRSAENALVGNRLGKPLHRWLQGVVDTMLAGPWLIIAGGHILIRRIAWVLATTVVLAVLLGFVHEPQTPSVILPSFLLAVGVVYFSTPSRSMTAGVNASRVAQVRQFILSTVDNPQQLQHLAQSVEVVRVHTLQKLGRFNVLAGIAWGVLFWFVGSHALAPGLSIEARSQGLSYTVVGMLIFGFALICGICHATAVRAVCQILEFAMIEAKAEVLPAYDATSESQTSSTKPIRTVPEL